MRKDSLQKLFPEIDTTTKTAFLFSFIAMLITHLYMFTNKIVHHDDVNRLLVGDTDEVKIQHGRWAGVFLTMLVEALSLFHISLEEFRYWL